MRLIKVNGLCHRASACAIYRSFWSPRRCNLQFSRDCRKDFVGQILIWKCIIWILDKKKNTSIYIVFQLRSNTAEPPNTQVLFSYKWSFFEKLLLKAETTNRFDRFFSFNETVDAAMYGTFCLFIVNGFYFRWSHLTWTHRIEERATANLHTSMIQHHSFCLSVKPKLRRSIEISLASSTTILSIFLF